MRRLEIFLENKVVLLNVPLFVAFCEAILVPFLGHPLLFFLFELLVDEPLEFPILRSSHPSRGPFPVRVSCHGTLFIILLGLSKLPFLKSSIPVWLHYALVTFEIKNSKQNMDTSPQILLLMANSSAKSSLLVRIKERITKPPVSSFTSYKRKIISNKARNFLEEPYLTEFASQQMAGNWNLPLLLHCVALKFF